MNHRCGDSGDDGRSSHRTKHNQAAGLRQQSALLNDENVQVSSDDEALTLQGITLCTRIGRGGRQFTVDVRAQSGWLHTAIVFHYRGTAEGSGHGGE